MKIARRIARTLTGSNRPPLSPASVSDTRCALYGPCTTPDCPSCGGIGAAVSPARFTAALAEINAHEQRRTEIASCDEMGVDPRLI